MRRIGIDVGGTNTDAVLIVGGRVLAGVKSPTTADVIGGVKNALGSLKQTLEGRLDEISSVTIGSTHFLNAVVERARLNRVAAVRICLPASASLPPFVDWPKDIADEVNGGVYMISGGHEYNGEPLSLLNEAEVADAAKSIRKSGVSSVAISGVFSPLNSIYEERAREIIQDICPDIQITCSHTLGRLGLLERENATLLNAALLSLAADATAAFECAVAASGIQAPLFISLNDGTVADAALARRFPVYCFASGATNSMRGAALLSGLDNALVCDVGGTTSDVGCLINGFPREANSVVTIGGVRTLFRMPDLLSVGIGGGTRVRTDPLKIGPDSVGFRLLEEARVFGGGTLTLTDVAVRLGRMQVGEKEHVQQLGRDFADNVMQQVGLQISTVVDRMKTEATDTPLVAVGGGAALIPEQIDGVSDVFHVENAAVANAVGAALAQISGETDQVYQGLSREEVLTLAEAEARRRAIDAGASEESLKVVEVEDIPIAYLPGHAIRARVRVIGDIQAG